MHGIFMFDFFVRHNMSDDGPCFMGPIIRAISFNFYHIVERTWIVI